MRISFFFQKTLITPSPLLLLGPDAAYMFAQQITFYISNNNENIEQKRTVPELNDQFRVCPFPPYFRRSFHSGNLNLQIGLMSENRLNRIYYPEILQSTCYN